MTNTIDQQRERLALLDLMKKTTTRFSDPSHKRVVRGVFLSTRAVKSGQGDPVRAQLEGLDERDSVRATALRYGSTEVS